MAQPRTDTQRSGLVVLGGGFAGIAAGFAADALRRRHSAVDDLRITVVNRDRWLTLRPRLYETSASGHQVDLVPLLADRGISLVTATARRILPDEHAVDLDGTTIRYERLVVATGSALRRPDVPGADRWAFDVDTAPAALSLQSHLNQLGDSAVPWPNRAVVVGAGLAGIEVAASLAETLAQAIATGSIDGPGRVHLVDPAATVDDLLGKAPGPALQAALHDSDVDLVLGERVVEVRHDGAILRSGAHLPAGTVVWTGGLAPSPLLADLGVPTGADERTSVDPTLAVAALSDMYAAGDVAVAAADEAHATTMSCQHAIPMGDTAGHNAAASLLGLPQRAFHASPYVTCIDVGAAGGIFTTGWDRQVAASGVEGRAIKLEILDAIDPRHWGEGVRERPPRSLRSTRHQGR